MNADRLGKRWRRTLRDALNRIRKLQSRPTLNADAVHALRVSLRRGRLLLLLGRPLFRTPQVREWRRRARQLLNALGPVRDCDVAAEWLSGSDASHATRQQLQLLRRQYWQAARLQLHQKLPVLRSPSKSGTRGNLVRRWKQLHTHALARAEALLKQPASLDEPTLHELRRQIRRRRYLLELVLHKHDPIETAHVREMVKFQEILGTAQNLAAIATVLGELPATPGARRSRKNALTAQSAAHRRALRARAMLPCSPPATRGSAASRH